MRSSAAIVAIVAFAGACVSLDGLSGGRGDAGPGDAGDAGPDKDPTGACAKAGLTCSAHSRCDETSGAGVCACVTGYVREKDACVWRGGPGNPGFTSLDVWKLGGNAVIDLDGGVVDPGFLDLDAFGDTAAQSFAMPAYVDAEPFAIVANGSALETGQLRPLVGRALAAFPDFTGAPTQQRACLGERAYGATIDFVLGLPIGQLTSQLPSLQIDHVSIVPAPDCPPVGTIPNGDFEGTGNWDVRPAGALAEIATGVGTKGGRAGRLATTTHCHTPAIFGSISSPSSLPRAALSFTYKGTSDQLMFLALADNAYAAVSGTGAFESAHICVPEHAKGTVLPLGFVIPDEGGTCTDPAVREFIFDDLAFVSDPTCPETASITDGGFEQTGASGKVTSWVTTNPGGFQSTADFLGEPRTGSAALRVGSGKRCDIAQGAQTISVPYPADSPGSGGPAVHFWYRTQPSPDVVFHAQADLARLDLAASSTYKNQTLCLDPKSIGRPAVLSFIADGGGGSCSETFPIANMFVDDVEVGHDPSCPAQ